MDVRMRHFEANDCNSNALTRHRHSQAGGNLPGKIPKVFVHIAFDIKDVIDFLFRNDEGVAFGQGTDVKESEKAVVFRYFVAGYFTLDNTCENTCHRDSV